jgi:hypothetical protein
MQQKVLGHGYHKAVQVCSMLFPFVTIGTKANLILMHVRNVQGLGSQTPFYLGKAGSWPIDDGVPPVHFVSCFSPPEKTPS